MIIEAREDVVTLRGKLSRNEWQNIKAAANHLLNNHSHGIIIDCAHIELATQAGIETFVDARLDIEAQGARIMLSSVPRDVLEAMRSVPGASSQLPVARSVEEARASLRLMNGKRTATGPDRAVILVPLLAPGDADFGVEIACRIAPRDRAAIHLLYIVPVPRALPIGTPLGDLSAVIDAELTRGEKRVRQQGLRVQRNIEQTRSVTETILRSAERVSAQKVVLGLQAIGESDEECLFEIVTTLLREGPCEIVVARAALGKAET
jgi:anti-anti-sigma regulatory factor